LSDSPTGQIAASEAGRESEIVFDPRAEAGLTTGGGAFDQERFQAICRAVNGGREPRRTAANHHEIIKRRFRFDPKIERVGDLLSARPDQATSVRKQDQRQTGGIDSIGRAQFLGFFAPFEIEPLIRHKMSREEVADFV